jgi:hypothetical protein
MRTIGMPEIVVIFGFFLVIPVAAFVFAYLTRRLRTQERLRAIDKGVTIPQLAEQDATRCRRVGIVSVALGLGLLIFGVAGPHFNRAVVASSAIPILIGLGTLLEYRLSVRDLKARNVPPQN